MSTAQVIGINAQIYSRTGGYMGMSFAIPIDLALNVENQLRTKGKVSRSRIGVAVQPVDQKLAMTFGLGTPHGALISAVEPKSPGERAGLKPGDVITSVNGHNIDHSFDLPTIIAEIPPGTEAHIGIWRDHKASQVDVKTVLLDDEPAQAARNDSEDGGGKLGLAVRPLEPEGAAGAAYPRPAGGRRCLGSGPGRRLAGGRCGAGRQWRGRHLGGRPEAGSRPGGPQRRPVDSARGRPDLRSRRHASGIRCTKDQA